MLGNKLEEASKQLEEAIKNLEENLDRQYLRKMHADMYTCASKCCQRNDDSVQQVRDCVEICKEPVDIVWDNVEHEITNFQMSLGKCLNECGDAIRKKFSLSNLNMPDNMAAYDKDLQECATNCAQRMLKAIPELQSRIYKGVEKFNKKER